jgi:glucosyl-3-phosphoglycerate synthase
MEPFTALDDEALERRLSATARDLALDRWLERRTYDADEFPLGRLQEAKRETVTVILPAKECATTLPAILGHVLDLREAGVVDEVLVVDADSRDGTATIARRLGADVAQESQLLPRFGPALGKGDAMWRGLAATSGEVVAFLDTDSERVEPAFVRGVLGPLLCHPELALVKGAFARPFRPADGSAEIPDGGGRVTELMARPLLNLHVPELAGFAQPLAGEIAARRSLLERLSFPVGYGIEIAMLIDALRAAGLDALAQVRLGTRQNRHQSLQALGEMSYAVLVAAERRLGRDPVVGAYLTPPTRSGGPRPHRVPVDERPPLTTIDDEARPAREAGGGQLALDRD